MSEIKNDERIRTIIEEFNEELDNKIQTLRKKENGEKEFNYTLRWWFKKRGYNFSKSDMIIDLNNMRYYFIGKGKDLMNKFEEENPEIFISFILFINIFILKVGVFGGTGIII